MESKEFLVNAQEAEARLDIFLIGRIEGSRSFIQNLIKADHVSVNQKVRKPNYRLTEGDVVAVSIPEAESVEIIPEDIPLDYIYEDHDIVIVNKPRGMVVHPALSNYSGTLVNALLFHCKDLSGINGAIRPGIVHRLDKDTSGVMMAAKNDMAHMGLAEQVKEHSAKRTYLALVQGNIVEEKGTIKAPIGRHPKDRMKMAVVFENSKEAITHFTVLERFGHHTLVECVLETGRTHQIRVHFAYIGHPVVNDPFYGYRKMDFPIQGQALHSHTLDIIHPISNKKMHFEADIPEDFLNCIEFAKQYRLKKGS
ncbi:pseudouridine synthase [Veillonella montpellierensis DNF00314]|uniref:Pseudouridine synthase n=1 Tax=Veillonella montpellierensis DNF00314 TaxID=1401067 RepID=A0A096CQY9_9FIRM|nr:RluA family pseudouridine synthase [Veillonella montpellierensis]KGF47749.1 pseudouridine synthase [Veillonella montpellierensis DNF00314]